MGNPGESMGAQGYILGTHPTRYQYKWLKLKYINIGNFNLKLSPDSDLDTVYDG